MDFMNLDKINHWASLLANIGVIAGIVFLGLELRQNNSLLAAQATYSLRQYRSDVADTIMAPNVLEATHKYAGGEKVTPAERSAVFMTALKVIELWEWQHGEFVAGRLEGVYLPVDSWRVWYYGEGESPVPIREIWESRKDVMNPAFVQFFEENVIDR
jgi:hypothetical protein